ncbi:MAG: hypothetical protein ACON47_03410 [Flavobacteriaceae bacterium]
MTFICLFAMQFSQAQDRAVLPFQEIGAYPSAFTPENVIIRMISGLGYRYYWASKELRLEDLNYRPSPEAQSTLQTLQHLYGLSEVVKNTSTNAPNIRPQDFSQMSYQELREGTLKNLQEAIEGIQKLETGTLETHTVRFQRSEKTTTFPYWHTLNGPLSDALYHTGQLVSFRRTTGNPIDPKVNVFMGKNSP